jgi:BirA family biotin operon repressor/biotin-[acetyl-CoA-carboxylase] ligase
MPSTILLQETTSTNDYLKRNADILPSGTVIVAYKQTAGRGQKGNSWEAEPGKNATLSLLIKKPKVDVKEQFAISEAVSLAIVDVLENYATGFKIKWPNDIYHSDSKIGGILIEHSLAGNGIDYTIAGVGVNINQQVFISGAPNPISLTHITGETYDMNAICDLLSLKMEQYCDFDGSPEQLAELHRRYLARLYRNDGKPHLFTTPDGTQFEATIDGVAPDGTLLLFHSNEKALHEYRFKEVGFVINRKTFI